MSKSTSFLLGVGEGEGEGEGEGDVALKTVSQNTKNRTLTFLFEKF